MCTGSLIHAGVMGTDWVKANRVGISRRGSLAWEDGECAFSSAQQHTVVTEITALSETCHTLPVEVHMHSRLTDM